MLTTRASSLHKAEPMNIDSGDSSQSMDEDGVDGGDDDVFYDAMDWEPTGENNQHQRQHKPQKQVAASENKFIDSEGDNDDDDDEIYYDAEDIDLTEEDNAGLACRGADLVSCDACCKHHAFDRPFWNRLNGECLCFMSQGEPNACKQSRSSMSCNSCCSTMGYLDFDFVIATKGCLCSNPTPTIAPPMLWG